MRILFLFFLLLVTLPVYSQEDKWQWWNDLHQWHPGMPGWRNFMILSPGYLGPNALPVPEMKNGIIPEKGEFQASLSRHFNASDPTQDISGRLLIPFYQGKVALEIYGVILENYGYSDSIRNIRYSRDKDGTGVGQGDFYFCFLIQLSKGRRFPDAMIRIACKTASGDAFAARFTDTPGYYFDIISSKAIRTSKYSILRPYASLGFYSWQTYNEATPQNDAFMYGSGAEWKKENLTVSGNLSGYIGYEKNRDKPVLITLETRYDWEKTAASVQLLRGLRDWNYTTFRFSFFWKFPGI